MNKWLRCVVLSLLAGFLAGPSAVQARLPEPLWYGTEPNGQPVVHLYLFWTKVCPHCQAALPFVAELAARHDWLKVHRYELTQNPANAELYLEMAGALGEKANAVPAFLFCESLRTGFADADTTGRRLEADLLACRERARGLAAAVPEESVDLPMIGAIDPGRFSLPVLTLLIAGLDAFNPCAFFVLLFLLSLLVRGQSRARMAVIGGLFVFFSGLMYFVFMAAWLNLFLLVGQLTLVTVLAGTLAIAMGAVNVKDYFFFKQGFSLSIPETAKPGLFQRMRRVVEAGRWPAMILSTVILAIVANSYELLCTAGLPMVYTRILTMSALSDTGYYLYLLFYNLIYVIPLLAIVCLFAVTLGARKLSERAGRRLKLLSGLMMLGLGIVLVVAPELLNNVLAAFLLIGGALLVTTLLAFRERRAAE